MSLPRTVLLKMSESRRMRAAFPRYAFMRRAVMRFMPGESLDDALRAGESLAQGHMGVVFTRLGENVLDLNAAGDVARHYIDALDRIKALQAQAPANAPLDAHISVKLTQLGLDISPAAAEANLRSIVEHAAEVGNTIWIDMEQSALVDATLDMYRRVRPDHPNLGICIQAYLRRTQKDIESLMPLVPMIRLVKGAYSEPPDVAFPERRDVDSEFLRLALLLLEASRSGKAIVGIATHDPLLIEQLKKHAAATQLPREKLEFQMLYGIRRDEQLRLSIAGYRVRVLISYGEYWYPWFMRRLAEKPSNVLFVVRNLVGL